MQYRLFVLVLVALAGSALAAGPAAPAGSWLSGDTHVHDDHSADGSALRQSAGQNSPGNVSVTDQMGQGVQNGLQWMPLTDHRTFDQHYDPLWESASLLLVTGEEANGSPHCTVQGAVDTIVQGGNRATFNNMQTSIWDAHAQGANWNIAHPDDGELNADGTPNAYASAVGYDNVETWNRASNNETEIDYAESRWNKGLRFGITGASDDHFRELWAIAGPGMPITQVFAGALTDRDIIQGLQAGRTTIHLKSIDPLVTLEADMDGDGVYEAIGGDEVIAPAGTAGKLRVHVTNGVGTTVMVYKSPGRANGAFASFTPMGIDNTFTVAITADAAPSWYRVEARGPGQPSGVNTGTTSELQDALQGMDLGSLLTIASFTAGTSSNALRAMCAPIFISSAPVVAAPELAIPADVGGDDGALLSLGSPGSFSGFPAIAAVADAVHLVAETHAPGATQVSYRRIEANGIQQPVMVLSGSSKSARFPKVAARGQDVYVVWQDERAGQVPRRPAIYLRHSADGGKTFAAEVLVRSLAGRAERPDVALTADGSPLVVWQEISAGNPFDIMGQIIGKEAAPVNLSRAGKLVMAATTTDTRSAIYPASVWPVIGVSPAGLLAVAWQDNRTDSDVLWTGSAAAGKGTDPDNWQIQVTTRAPSASTWAAPVSMGSNTAADRHPALTFTPDGTLVVAWDSKALSSSGANLSIVATTSKDSGKTFAAPVTVAPSNVGMGEYPKLGTSSDGTALLAWYDSRSADWRWRVTTATLNTKGIAGWSDASTLMSKAVNTWPAVSNGVMAFASTRNATRLQRDRTQQIFLLQPKADPTATTPTGTPTTPATSATPVTPTTPVVPPVIQPVASTTATMSANESGRFGGGALGAAWLLLLPALARRRPIRR